jgi:hypothetical protein
MDENMTCTTCPGDPHPCVDMTTCQPGDRLRTRHGEIVTYVGRRDGAYPHEIRYANGSSGTRTDDGHVYAIARLPEYDHDIFSEVAYDVDA